MGYRGYTLCCAILAVISLTLNSLKNADLICKKKTHERGQWFWDFKLRIQPITGDEIKSFVIKLRITPIDENIKQDLRMLKQNLESLNI